MSGHRVLVVEDDVHILGYCTTALEAEGFVVDACGTMSEARTMFDANRPDLVVLDIGLPDGTGMELMRELHGRAGLKVPVMFLTGRRDLKTRLACFQLGAQDYMQKPFAVEELTARACVHLHIQKSHEALVKRNYELELVDRARQDMADMIVHDLKSPLSAIKSTIELISAHHLIRPEDYRLLQNAGTAADFMLLMLNDMLDLAQAAHVDIKVEISDFDPALLLRKIETLFEGRVKAHKTSLVLRAARGMKKIHADPNLVYRMLVNLVANAFKASPKGSCVEVDCASVAGVVRFVVSDRGGGVRDADKKMIFEKYVTSGRKDAVVDTGTGIGLSFCRVAAKAHKGRIWVEDRPGGGSLFIIELPQ